LEGDHVELENPTLQSEDSDNLAYIRVKLIGERTDARKRGFRNYRCKSGVGYLTELRG